MTLKLELRIDSYQCLKDRGVVQLAENHLFHSKAEFSTEKGRFSTSLGKPTPTSKQIVNQQKCNAMVRFSTLSLDTFNHCAYKHNG
jgi:hypothetical protein